MRQSFTLDCKWLVSCFSIIGALLALSAAQAAPVSAKPPPLPQTTRARGGTSPRTGPFQGPSTREAGRVGLDHNGTLHVKEGEVRILRDASFAQSGANRDGTPADRSPEAGWAIFLHEGATATVIGSLTLPQGPAPPTTPSQEREDGGARVKTGMFMMSRSQVNFHLTSDLILATPIEGNLGVGNRGSKEGGGLLKTGSALLSLCGANTYSGQTVAREGELNIDGSLTSDIEIDGGVLTGSFSTRASPETGVVGRLTLNRGHVHLGSRQAGGVHLAGAFIQNGGTLSIDITPNPLLNHALQTPQAVIEGGDVEINLGPGNYIAGTVLTPIGGPLSGKGYPAGHIAIGGPFAELVDIDVDPETLTIQILTSSLFQGRAIASTVAQTVANSMKSTPVALHSDFAYVLELLGTFSDIDTCLEALAPAQFGSLEWINARNFSQIAEVLSDHLLELCCTNRNSCDPCANATFWLAGYGNVAKQTAFLDQLPPFDSNSAGLIAGFDRSCFSWIFGGAVGYTYTDLHWQQGRGAGKINSYYGSLYTSYRAGCAAFDLALIGGGSNHMICRQIPLAGLDRKATSDPWGYLLTAHFGGRGTWNCCRLGLEGFALADYHFFNREAFQESGARSLDLAVESQTQHLMRGELGVRIYYPIICNCYCWSPYLSGSWVCDFPLNDAVQNARLRPGGPPIEIDVYDSPIQMGSPEIGCRLTYDCGPSMLIGYKGLLGARTQVHQVSVRFEWVF